jgi:predicted RNA-binding protein with PIN domain
MQIFDNALTIIDGYNLIFQCGLEGRSRNPLALEKARARLVATLAEFISAENLKRTILVFDAEVLPIKEVAKVSVQSGLTVVFATDYEDADTLIEELIRSHASPKQLTVVSSDHRLHKAALRRKATPVDSDIWFERVESGEFLTLKDGKPTDATDGTFEKDLPAGLQDVDWSKEFGFDQDND